MSIDNVSGPDITKIITLRIPVAAPSIMAISALSKVMDMTGEEHYNAIIAWFFNEYASNMCREHRRTKATEEPFDMETLK